MKEEQTMIAPAQAGDVTRFLTSRTLAEIGASIDAHIRIGCAEFIQAGADLIDAKEKAGRGEWLPFLAARGIPHSTAANWMRVAREISPDSPLAQLPYSKTLALLAVPAEEREAFAAENQDKSAAEIRRLIEERNRAMEAANAASTQAGEWKKKAQAAEIEAQEAGRQVEALRQRMDELAAQPPTQERLVVPDDYNEIKDKLRWAQRSTDAAAQAALEAEQRANAAEAELAQMRLQGTPQRAPEGGVEALAEAVTRFIADTQLMAVNPGPLAARMKDADALIRRLSRHVIELQKAIADAEWQAEGAVI